MLCPTNFGLEFRSLIIFLSTWDLEIPVCTIVVVSNRLLRNHTCMHCMPDRICAVYTSFVIFCFCFWQPKCLLGKCSVFAQIYAFLVNGTYVFTRVSGMVMTASMAWARFQPVLRMWAGRKECANSGLHTTGSSVWCVGTALCPNHRYALSMACVLEHMLSVCSVLSDCVQTWLTLRCLLRKFLFAVNLKRITAMLLHGNSVF